MHSLTLASQVWFSNQLVVIKEINLGITAAATSPYEALSSSFQGPKYFLPIRTTFLPNDSRNYGLEFSNHGVVSETTDLDSADPSFYINESVWLAGQIGERSKVL